MLFRNKNCPNCHSSYDIVEDTCPVCHAHNDDFEALKIPKNQIWLPIYKQLFLFLLGILILNLISVAGSLIFGKFFAEDDPTLPLILNLVRYSAVSIGMAIVLIHSYPKFKNSFKQILPYIVGFCAGFLLIGINIAYNNFVGLFYTKEINENQQIANAMVAAYPFLSLLLLGFIGPAVEEFTYRVGLFSFLSRIHRAVAYIVTIIIFALIHFDFGATGDALINEFVNLPIYMISGAALCFLYDSMGLPASLMAHTVNNILATLPIMISNAIK